MEGPRSRYPRHRAGSANDLVVLAEETPAACSFEGTCLRLGDCRNHRPQVWWHVRAVSFRVWRAVLAMGHQIATVSVARGISRHHCGRCEMGCSEAYSSTRHSRPPWLPQRLSALEIWQWVCGRQGCSHRLRKTGLQKHAVVAAERLRPLLMGRMHATKTRSGSYWSTSCLQREASMPTIWRIPWMSAFSAGRVPHHRPKRYRHPNLRERQVGP